MRAEFTRATKRAALKRSQGRCEASGAFYRLESVTRCNADLAFGAEFDHIILDANSHDNSLENCAAVCVKCHKWKTRNRDIPTAAKTRRQQDAYTGIRRKSRGFDKRFTKHMDGRITLRGEP